MATPSVSSAFPNLDVNATPHSDHLIQPDFVYLPPGSEQEPHYQQYHQYRPPPPSAFHIRPPPQAFSHLPWRPMPPHAAGPPHTFGRPPRPHPALSNGPPHPPLPSLEAFLPPHVRPPLSPSPHFRPPPSHLFSHHFGAQPPLGFPTHVRFLGTQPTLEPSSPESSQENALTMPPVSYSGVRPNFGYYPPSPPPTYGNFPSPSDLMLPNLGALVIGRPFTPEVQLLSPVGTPVKPHPHLVRPPHPQRLMLTLRSTLHSISTQSQPIFARRIWSRHYASACPFGSSWPDL
jgi:hypothetical protein